MRQRLILSRGLEERGVNKDAFLSTFVSSARLPAWHGRRQKRDLLICGTSALSTGVALHGASAGHSIVLRSSLILLATFARLT
jgi:hypothetical protein